MWTWKTAAGSHGTLLSDPTVVPPPRQTGTLAAPLEFYPASTSRANWGPMVPPTGSSSRS